MSIDEKETTGHTEERTYGCVATKNQNDVSFGCVQLLKTAGKVSFLCAGKSDRQLSTDAISASDVSLLVDGVGSHAKLGCTSRW